MGHRLSRLARRQRLRAAARVAAIAVVGFAAGVHFASAPLLNAERADPASLFARIQRAESHVTARRGELELFRIELSRLRRILEQSAAHRIPADLSASIYDIATAEGIDPALAYRLVAVESEFATRAVSHRGAIGLTQVMPATAFELAPSLRREDLFERDTNLHLGFRYLRQMIDRYDGDLRLALLAYNRGPGTVDSIRSDGGDPANGYARRVLGMPSVREAPAASAR
ncbi:MAG: lytic transglycosylase domain-containing protein [Longimicrobiales bacterium]